MSKPKPMSGERMMEVLGDSLASLGELREAGTLAIAEIDRLKAEIAAKDAEIARRELALSEYECWMRDVIESDACWPKGDTLPTLTQELYDRFLAIRSSGKTFGSGKRGAK